MRYLSFRIRNFKGIKDTTINLRTASGAGVFALVGLNESGKTTILEAIHSFAPDPPTSRLVGGDQQSGVPFNERVPRHLISTFTGHVSVEARLSIEAAELAEIAKRIRSEHGIELDVSDFGETVIIDRQQEFKDGDFQGNYFTLRNKQKIKTGRQKNWRDPSKEERIKIREIFYTKVPTVAYFPTFVFDFPERIYLTDRGSNVDQFYRATFQDILDYDGRGHTIEKDIVRRVRGDTFKTPWTAFLSLWTKHDDRDKIQHVMDRASAAVTNLVFGHWNEIFGEDVKKKEILITPELSEGEVKDASGAITKTNEHDISIKFQIRDGTRRFSVNDRSLGFRWFFAFMLFTQFRVAREKSQPMMFLFDEPASNLHAAAQHKLLDSFPAITKADHRLVYTTHSHYMVEPRWLEQTFIVTNRADAPELSVVEGVSLDDESLDIQATSYRQFVNKHPNQTSYFQPILDRLRVAPSRFDILKPSIVVEGKSDYYIIRYIQKLLKLEELPIIPAMGAGTMDSLAALHVGWNLDFHFLLDGDNQGKLEKERYASDYGIKIDRLMTLDELIGKTKIEKLLDNAALNAVQKALGLSQKPTKNQLRRFFQEALAADKLDPLSAEFKKSGKQLITALRAKVS